MRHISGQCPIQQLFQQPLPFRRGVCVYPSMLSIFSQLCSWITSGAVCEVYIFQRASARGNNAVHDVCAEVLMTKHNFHVVFQVNDRLDEHHSVLGRIEYMQHALCAAVVDIARNSGLMRRNSSSSAGSAVENLEQAVQAQRSLPGEGDLMLW